MEEDKVQAIRDWHTPETLKQVQAFLGFVNFYRRTQSGDDPRDNKKRLNTLHHPKHGPLMWVGDGPRPDDAWQMSRTKLYVANKCVGNSVYGVVTKSKGQFPDLEWKADGTWWVWTDRMQEWIANAVWEWRAKTPEMYHNLIKELTRDQVANLLFRKGMSKGQFFEWLDHYSWNQHMGWEEQYEAWEHLDETPEEWAE
ncbi:hypothetical protein FRC10_011018 [Ceratobasidium sp. 414]|nr:hypothetical protein FRC10_011018 [Ceratobasidium sp. 414]